MNSSLRLSASLCSPQVTSVQMAERILDACDVTLCVPFCLRMFGRGDRSQPIAYRGVEKSLMEAVRGSHPFSGESCIAGSDFTVIEVCHAPRCWRNERSALLREIEELVAIVGCRPSTDEPSVCIEMFGLFPWNFDQRAGANCIEQERLARKFVKLPSGQTVFEELLKLTAYIPLRAANSTELFLASDFDVLARALSLSAPPQTDASEASSRDDMLCKWLLGKYLGEFVTSGGFNRVSWDFDRTIMSGEDILAIQNGINGFEMPV